MEMQFGRVYLTCTHPWVPSPAPTELSEPTYSEFQHKEVAEVGPEIHGHPWLHSQFGASPGYMREKYCDLLFLVSKELRKGGVQGRANFV